ncbi:Cof-type HAD-IIB family hydrolase [Microbacterium sp. JB110]|uniref:Cof-type HAD-IIB family hydrolase n=1 Tax=Microbacterium sp. JB110 TaxID=2024477 RepID=UPI00097F672E|nr:Cof-type HAD-IIB family hydrolase [Microbacterium sp. JB110]RCS60896.1 Cof-type HAD-IIB family hydrolase [Microbacterium sp. JB110]SJM64193.1 hypothetical protein CZ774_12565 [Frigoribacterium sp. JB110]
MPNPLPFDTTDIRLLVTDMDGTLLDEEGRIPDGLWPRLEALTERGIVFAPASGRQYGMIARLFEQVLAGMVVIAENGAFVVQDGEELSSITIERSGAARIVDALRAYEAAGNEVGLVVCGKRGAYVERTDPMFAKAFSQYYAYLTAVDDALDHDDEILKLAVADFEGQGRLVKALEPFAASHQVVVSGQHWVDIMSPAVDKGVAVRALQQRLGVTPAQTVAFGDYLNDLQMLDAAEHSFAMANAHPAVQERAKHITASNTEGGVLQVIDRILAA